MIDNEAFGWLWIMLGFVSGGWLGLNFSRPEWLGGYGEYRRRLVRLGHISFFGLGILNILFSMSAARLHLDPGGLRLASMMFVIGGATMPTCCALTAWNPRCKPLFAVPVGSLLVAGGLVCFGLVRR